MASTFKELYLRIMHLFWRVKPARGDGLLAGKSLASAAAIIVPIRVSYHAREALIRLERLLTLVPDCFEVVIVDDGSTARWQKEVCRLALSRPNTQYCYLQTQKQRFSLARARNHGAGLSNSDIILFHDLDFLGTTDTYLQIAEIIQQKLSAEIESKFFCIPVAFLTESGTRGYLKFLEFSSGEKNWDFYDYAGRNDGVKFLVQGSSCIVLHRQYFLDLGGHDESYDGHGAEDFELLHRLSSNYLIAERPVDYPVNTGSGKIIEYRGFRAFFALYGEECMKMSCVLVHLYHPKRKDPGYYQHERNFAKLKSLMQNDSFHVNPHG